MSSTIPAALLRMLARELIIPTWKPQMQMLVLIHVLQTRTASCSSGRSKQNRSAVSRARARHQQTLYLAIRDTSGTVQLARAIQSLYPYVEMHGTFPCIAFCISIPSDALTAFAISPPTLLLALSSTYLNHCQGNAHHVDGVAAVSLTSLLTSR